MNAWAETDRMSPSPEQERELWEDEEAARLDRLKPALLRSLVGFWSDVDEVRQRAGINVGASPAAWRALNDLVADGLAECSLATEEYRLTDKGRAAIAKAEGRS